MGAPMLFGDTDFAGGAVGAFAGPALLAVSSTALSSACVTAALAKSAELNIRPARSLMCKVEKKPGPTASISDSTLDFSGWPGRWMSVDHNEPLNSASDE